MTTADAEREARERAVELLTGVHFDDLSYLRAMYDRLTAAFLSDARELAEARAGRDAWGERAMAAETALECIATSGCEGDDEHRECGDVCEGHEQCDCFPHQAALSLRALSAPTAVPAGGNGP